MSSETETQQIGESHSAQDFGTPTSLRRRSVSVVESMEHDLEAMKSQVELQKLVIEDLQHKLSDSAVLVDKLQAELLQERMKNASHPPSHPALSQSIPTAAENGSLPQVAPGSRLNEALSIITSLRQSIRP